jgi:Inner membrane component of T3SS, cytoplasmic domain
VERCAPAAALFPFAGSGVVMNWMKIALKALGWRLMALGALAGLWGGLLREAALLLPPGALWQTAHALLAGAALGLGLGLFLAPADALLQHLFRRAARSALAGALLGALLGAAGAWARLALAHGMLARWASPTLLAWGGAGLSLGLVGAGCGLAAAIGSGRHGRRLHAAGSGLVAGALLGVALGGAAHLAADDPWAVLGALAVWGALLALALHWWERRRARRWLRLLTGPGEDSIFPLAGGQITLGKNERNDIPLRDFQEIFPYHCELHWTADHYEIVDNEQGGVVLVNYRQVQEHALRPGDLIKIGTALLQYGEAS